MSRNTIWNKDYSSLNRAEFEKVIEHMLWFYASCSEYFPAYIEVEIWFHLFRFHHSRSVCIVLNADGSVYEFNINDDDWTNRKTSVIKKNIKRFCDEVKKERLILELSGIE